jgi:hypothetical protein
MKHITIQGLFLFSAASIISGSLSCFAGEKESSVSFQGNFDVMGVGYDNARVGKPSKLSKHHQDYAFFSAGNIGLDYQMRSDDLKYGVKISLQHTSRNDRSGALSVYMETPSYGKIELGSERSAAGKMMITGYKCSVGFGNGWDMFIGMNSVPNGKEEIGYITNFGGFIDGKSRMSNMSDFGRKVTYFSPWIGSKESRLQFGISYMPDTSNAGFLNINSKHLYAIVPASDYKFAIIDAMGYGAVYESILSKDLSAKLSITGEIGKPIAFEGKKPKKSDVKFSQVKSYNIGSEIKYQQFTFAGSYMNYNKSVTNKNIDIFGRNTYLYSFGIKYAFPNKKYAISAVYFFSDHKTNKINATSLEADYRVAKGLKLYAQASFFATNGSYTKKNVVISDKIKGSIFIIGSKLAF